VRISLLDSDVGMFSVVVDDAVALAAQSPTFRIDNLAAAADVMAGREHLAPDLAAELDFPVEAGLYADELRSSVTLPLRATDRVVGALRLCWRQVGAYRSVNIASLAQIADAIALALEKSRLFAETRRRADELSTLVSVSTALRAARGSHDMLPICLEQACQATGAVVSTIFLLEPEQGLLILRGSYPPDPNLIGLHQAADQGIAGYVARSGNNYVSRDLQSDPLVRLDEPVEANYLRSVRSSLTVPLRTHEGVVGVLHVGLDRPHDFADEEVHLLTAIAEISGSALQRANLLETLEERVTERTRMLAEANERLKELDRLKDQFISNVSHELRTPLTNIKLHLSLLERRGTDALGRYLPTIQRETERLRRLIEDLLDLSRLQAQIAAPRRQPQNLDHLLGEIIALHATRAETRGLNLAQLAAAARLDVPVDRAQMLQVFTNLIGNAIAYTPPGGSVQISSQPQENQGRPGIMIYFKNWPAVIPADDLPHLFDRFFRGTTALESGEAGTGLGLAISKDIVELHGGRIWVDSAADAVITVGIWLPLSQ
jgi:signal transduction histidine kinase